jgi:hypothetical protein
VVFYGCTVVVYLAKIAVAVFLGIGPKIIH